jgi:magnesium-transporting ATPase (P-type)
MRSSRNTLSPRNGSQVTPKAALSLDSTQHLAYDPQRAGRRRVAAQDMFVVPDPPPPVLTKLKDTAPRSDMDADADAESDKRYILLSKGVDNVILERLKKGDDELKGTTEGCFSEFVSNGLRMLRLAWRFIGGTCHGSLFRLGRSKLFRPDKEY